MDKFNTLSINQLSTINGGRRHHRSWAKCATGTLGGATVIGGSMAAAFSETGLGALAGAGIGGVGGALSGASKSCF